MKALRNTFALALAVAAVPAAAVAANAPPAGLGILFMGVRNDVTVKGILPGGAAQLMGVQLGDVITNAGGRRITSASSLTHYIQKLKVGDSVQLTVRRKGKKLELSGTAMARSPNIDGVDAD